MSWSQWPNTSGIPQPTAVPAPLINPATLINPAPNVLNPAVPAVMSGQYTPEQWAQMQQQNWQQWAQWQQQFQQWQQQYGAEYQKSITALAQTAPTPVQPPSLFSINTSAPPPLPVEAKPPPPPDDPQQTPPFPSFTNAPPPSQTPFNSAPPPQPPPPKEPFQNQFNLQTAPNQAGFGNRNVNEAFKSGPNQGFGGNQNNNARDPGKNQNWQNQNRWNQQGFGDNQSTDSADTRNRGNFGGKRPFNHPNDAGDQKRNKIEPNLDEKMWQDNQRRWEAPVNQTQNTRWSSANKSAENVSKPDPEELSEAEKKFDRQFSEWESQFKKWKEQNVNHPDKEQYSQYEKKWETWRSQLLERREQMRRKRLGLINESPQPTTDKSTTPKLENIQQKLPDQAQGNVNKASSFAPGYSQQQIGPRSFPPGNAGKSSMGEFSLQSSGAANFASPKQDFGKLEAKAIAPVEKEITAASDLPLDFKKSNLEVGAKVYSGEEKVAELNEGGFLQSVATGGIPGLDLVKDGKGDGKHFDEPEDLEMQQKPDLEAISRGINSILGDKRLMNMLSLVSQNQSQPVTSSTPVVDSPTVKRNSPKFSPPDMCTLDGDSNQDNTDYASRIQHDTFLNSDDQTRSSFHQQEFEGHQQNMFGKHSKYVVDEPDEFCVDNDNYNQGPDMRNRPPPLLQWNPSNLNRGASDINKGPGNPNINNAFSGAAANFNRNPNSFNRGLENFNRGPENFNREPENFNRGPENFNREPENFNRGPENFNRGGNNFNGGRSSGNLNRKLDNFNQGFDTTNREEFFQRPDSCDGPLDNFTNRPGNFNRGGGNRGGGNFNRAQDTFGARKPELNFMDATNRAPTNLNRSQDNFKKGLDNFNRGPDNLSKGQSNFGQGHHNFYNEPDHYDRGADNFNKMTEDPDNFNFGRGPNNFNRQPGFREAPDRFNRARDDFNRASEDFPRYERGSHDFEPNSGFHEDADFDQRSGHFNKGDGYGETLENEAERFSANENYEEDAERYSGTPCTFNEDSNNIGQRRGQDLSGRGLHNMGNEKYHPDPDSLRNKEVKPVEDGMMWKASNVVDYDHKPLKSAEPDVIVETVHSFDYRHKPLNRIPYPQRPKWLMDMLKNYPEFDTGPFQQLRRYPLNERFDARLPVDNYAKYDDRYRQFHDGWDRTRAYNEFERKLYDERERKYLDDWDRKSYSNPPRKMVDNKVDDRRRDVTDNRVLESTKTFSDRKSVSKEYDNGKSKRGLQNNEESNPSSVHDVEKVESLNPPPPSKVNVTLIEDLLSPPGRYNRAPRLVIILRGPPGSGKSFLAKLIKDKEVENGGSAPRILCLDDYFMVEQEKEIEEDGKKVKIKDMVYEYEECMEASYRMSLMKSFKKTITDGYFSFIIVDNINEKVKYFGEMWSFAKQNGFQVYICQMELDVQTCTKRNIHGRSESEIERCVSGWEKTPPHHPVLDATSLIQFGSIPEVEMEEINSPPSETMSEEEHLNTSKWDNIDYSVDNLAKLDGISKPLRPSRTMEDYLQLKDDWAQPVSAKPGQKRVRWADLEERKEQEKMRAIGFVVGQTNWDRMMDPTMGSGALTQTKYIDRYH